MPQTACPVVDHNCITPDITDASERIALLNIYTVTHSTIRVTGVKPKKVSHPTISLGNSSEHWQYLLRRWNNYRHMMKITSRGTSIQLMGCCKESLQGDPSLIVMV